MIRFNDSDQVLYSRVMLGVVVALLSASAACQRTATTTPPGASGDTVPQASLLNTYWKLVQIGELPVAPTAEGEREAHIVFGGEGNRVQGNTGCNSLGGSYTLDGERISLAQLISTRMACATSMELEQKFLDALQGVARWEIKGERLTLFGNDGKARAAFEAVYLR